MPRVLHSAGRALRVTTIGLLIAASAGLHAGRAAAAETVIGFDDLAAGATVTTQYAARGVVFGRDQSGVQQDPPVVATAGALAHSSPNVAVISECGGEFCRSRRDGFLASLATHVTVWAGDVGNDTDQTVQLCAYDPSGTPVGRCDTRNVHGNEGVVQALGVSSGDRRIASFSLDVIGSNFNSARHVAIDDLAFDVPDEPPTPDFGLVGPTAPLSVDPGHSVLADILLRRLNGSHGQIALTVTNAPPGVTATITPNPTAGADGTHLTLKLTADASAADSESDIDVAGDPDSTSGTSPRAAHLHLLVGNPRQFDVRARGLEVYQSVQPFESYLPPVLAGQRLQSVPYAGVPLAAHNRTIVRFYADAPRGAPVSTREYLALLHGFRDGRELPGSPILAEDPRPLPDSGAPYAPLSERLDPKAGLSFELPNDWAEGTIDLEAQLLTPTQGIFAGDRVECPQCRADNSERMDGVHFTTTPTISIATLRMRDFKRDDPTKLPDAQSVFSAARDLHPGGDLFDVRPYLDVVDVTDIDDAPACSDTDPACRFPDHNDAFLDLVSRWVSEHSFADQSDLVIGVNNGHERGSWANHSLYNLPLGNPDLTANPNEVSSLNAAFVDATRPVGSVAHELGHDLGRAHAGRDCGGGGDPWPPDFRGFLEGIGFDRRIGSGGGGVYGGPGLFNVFAQPDPGRPDSEQFFDVMSYCGPDDRHWISVPGWRRELAELHRYGIRTGRLPASPGADGVHGPITASVSPRAVPAPSHFYVDALLFPDGAPARVTSFYRTRTVSPTPASSSIHALLRDPAGRTLADVPLTVGPHHSHDQAGVVEASGDLPLADGVASVQIASGATVLAQRMASAHAPTIRLLVPRAHAVLGRRSSVTIAWRALDRDRDPLLSIVENSTDGGRSWNPLFMGRTQQRISLPRAMIARASHAQLRVRVDDGFHETTSQVIPVRSRGGPPTATILSPDDGERILSTDTVNLRGQAHDDRGLPITASRLVWRSGRRRLGQGAALTLGGLAPGTRRITLIATDRYRRRGTATVAVRVRGVRPFFLELSPSRLARHASRLRLVVASSLPATLTVRGKGAQARRVAVTRHARTIAIRVTSSRRSLRLRLRLTAPGGATTRTLVIPRD